MRTEAEPQLRVDRRDLVMLAPDVELVAGGLADVAAEEVYELNEVGRFLAARFDGRSDFAALVDEVSTAFDVEADQAREDCLSFLGRLDTRALVLVQPGLPMWARAGRFAKEVVTSRGRVLLGKDWLATPLRSARRRPPTLHGVLVACFVAHRSVMVPIVLLSMVAAAATVAAAPLVTEVQWWAWRGLILSPAMLVVVHMTLMVVHEAGHLAAIRAVGLSPYYTVVRGFSVGIVHGEGGPGQEQVVSVAGPMAALLTGLLLTIAVPPWLVARYVPQAMSILPAALGVAHAMSLTPWGADGKRILGAQRARRALDRSMSEAT